MRKVKDCPKIIHQVGCYTVVEQDSMFYCQDCGAVLADTYFGNTRLDHGKHMMLPGRECKGKLKDKGYVFPNG